MVRSRGVVYTRVPILESNVMSGPEKIRSRGSWSHIVSKATKISGKMTGYCVFECKK